MREEGFNNTVNTLQNNTDTNVSGGSSRRVITTRDRTRGAY